MIKLAPLLFLVVTLPIVIRVAQPAEAAFHFAVIDEVMFGTSGDSTVEYVEIKMLAGGQNVVQNSRLSAWNADGSFFGVLLLVPANVSVSGTNVSWIMATSSFAAAAGIAPDFTFASVSLPSTGMICWGAPGSVPPNPPTWDPALPANYVDCVPYGGYMALPNKYGSCPTAPTCSTPFGLGDGISSLTRISNTSNPPVDWGLACPSPKNNAGHTGLIGMCGLPTSTPTPTATATPTQTATPTATATPCVAPDPDGDGICDALDNCPADNNPAQTNSDSGPPPPSGNVGAIGNGSGIPGHDVTVPNGDALGDVCDPDNDNDGLPDSVDLEFGLPRDLTVDDDGDGLAATGCYGGTDADDDGVSWDIDCDGRLDGAPVICGSAIVDSDADGLMDAWETCHWGTSNASANSDGDGLRDCVEAMDANGNSAVTNADAVFVQQAVFVIIGGDWTFDMNGNGAITNGDAVLIKQAVFNVPPLDVCF